MQDGGSNIQADEDEMTVERLKQDIAKHPD